MPSKDPLDNHIMEVDDDFLEILEEIPKSPTFKNQFKWKPKPMQHFSASNQSQVKLKQANQKITQQRDVILELQDKLKHQTGKLNEATKIITNQKKLLQGSQRGKLKLRQSLDIERKRGREIFTKLLEFFKHIDSEFSFTIDILNGKSNKNSPQSKCAIASETNIIGIENQLKQLSIRVANKLKKLKNMEAERVTEVEKDKITVNQIQAKNQITTKTGSTQTNMTSIDFDKPINLISSNSTNRAPLPDNHQAPMRLRLKRAHYEYQQQNDFCPEVSVDSSKYCKVANIKERVDNIKVIPIAPVTAINSNYLDSDKLHAVANKKHELNLLYCACGLTFSSQEWLNNHIKLFDSLWGSEKDEMKGNICGKVNQTPNIGYSR